MMLKEEVVELDRGLKMSNFLTNYVPLSVLQEHYIPLFEDTEQSEEKVQAILQLTKGSFSTPISIIDNGEVIDELPPLIEGSAAGIRYNQLLSDVELKNRHMPGSGDNLSRSVLSQEEVAITDHIRKAWIPTLTRYKEEKRKVEIPEEYEMDIGDVLEY